MLAYLIRRHLFTLIFAPLLVYTLVIYTPSGPPRELGLDYPLSPAVKVKYPVYLKTLSLHWDKPWPVNYAAYVFNPDDTGIVDRNGNAITNSIDIDLFSFHVRGSGALTGDFGLSLWEGTPVNQLFGRGLGELFAAILCLLAILMVVAILQQRRRPKVYPPIRIPDLLGARQARRAWEVS